MTTTDMILPHLRATAEGALPDDPEAFARVIAALRANDALQTPAALLASMSSEDVATTALALVYGVTFCDPARALAFYESTRTRARAFMDAVGTAVGEAVRHDDALAMVRGYAVACAFEASRRAVDGFDLTVVTATRVGDTAGVAMILTHNDAPVEPVMARSAHTARLRWAAQRAMVCGDAQAKLLEKLAKGAS